MCVIRMCHKTKDKIIAIFSETPKSAWRSSLQECDDGGVVP